MRSNCLILAIWAFITSAIAVHAENTVYDLYIAGFKAGEFTTDVRLNGDSYKGTAKIRPTGLLKAVAKVRFDASSHGRVQGRRLIPKSYDETTVGPDRISTVKLKFANNLPQIVAMTTNSGSEIPPATPPKGSVDMMAMIIELGRSVGPENLCRQKYTLFDGQRTIKVAIAKPAFAKTGATCVGVYKRLAGFSPRELKRGDTLKFTLKYGKTSDGLFRLSSFETGTHFGRAKAIRR